MKSIFTQTIIFTLLFSFAATSLFSQGSVRLNFEGIMKDIEENRIAEDEFKLLINVISNPSGEILLEKSHTLLTDKQGWFGFDIGEFDRFFTLDQSGTSTIFINLELIPTRNSKWIEQGRSFPVSYKILKVAKSDSLLFEIARMEGSRAEELRFLNQDDMLFFRDTYPFGYLQGGFMISLDLSSEKLAILRNIIDEDSDTSGEATKSRGVKGGFAVGGYRKTK